MKYTNFFEKNDDYNNIKSSLPYPSVSLVDESSEVYVGEDNEIILLPRGIDVSTLVTTIDFAYDFTSGQQYANEAKVFEKIFEMHIDKNINEYQQYVLLTIENEKPMLYYTVDDDTSDGYENNKRLIGDVSNEPLWIDWLSKLYYTFNESSEIKLGNFDIQGMFNYRMYIWMPRELCEECIPFIYRNGCSLWLELGEEGDGWSATECS